METTDILLMISGLANAIMIVWMWVLDGENFRLQRRIEQLELEKRSGLDRELLGGEG